MAPQRPLVPAAATAAAQGPAWQQHLAETTPGRARPHPTGVKRTALARETSAVQTRLAAAAPQQEQGWHRQVSDCLPEGHPRSLPAALCPGTCPLLCL